MGLLALLLLVWAGCGGGGDDNAGAPPKPQPGATPSDPFYVRTSNYYDTQTGAWPAQYQMASGLYPAAVSYASIPNPQDFDLKTEGERSIIVLAEADPRVSIISGVAPADARIETSLVESISYDGLTNIIGLTQVRLISGTPYYDVSVVTVDPATGGPMQAWEMKRVLTHEYGHVYGLGHSPDERDLMYYRSNSEQGGTPETFMTYGDALTLWTTLNARSIRWYSDRPTITQAGGSTIIRRDPAFRHKHVNPADGPVLCVVSR